MLKQLRSSSSHVGPGYLDLFKTCAMFGEQVNSFIQIQCFAQGSPRSIEILSGYSSCVQSCAGDDLCVTIQCQTWIDECLNDGGSTPTPQPEPEPEPEPLDPSQVGQGDTPCSDVVRCMQSCDYNGDGEFTNTEIPCQNQCLFDASPESISIFQSYNECYDQCLGDDYCLELNCQVWVDACLNDVAGGNSDEPIDPVEPIDPTEVRGEGTDTCMEVVACLQDCAFDFDPATCEATCVREGSPTAVSALLAFDDCYVACNGEDLCVDTECQDELMACVNDGNTNNTGISMPECEYSWECDWDQVCSPEQMCVGCNEDWDCTGFGEVCNQVTNECEPM